MSASSPLQARIHYGAHYVVHFNKSLDWFNYMPDIMKLTHTTFPCCDPNQAHNPFAEIVGFVVSEPVEAAGRDGERTKAPQGADAEDVGGGPTSATLSTKFAILRGHDEAAAACDNLEELDAVDDAALPPGIVSEDVYVQTIADIERQMNTPGCGSAGQFVLNSKQQAAVEYVRRFAADMDAIVMSAGWEFTTLCLG